VPGFLDADPRDLTSPVGLAELRCIPTEELPGKPKKTPADCSPPAFDHEEFFWQLGLLTL